MSFWERDYFKELSSKHCIIDYCDYLKFLKKLPDNSVSLIVTDPPYGLRFKSLYQGLARESQRILTPNGSLFIMMGEYHLLSLLNEMAKYLNHQRNIALYMEGSRAILKEKQIRNKKKDIAWFCKSNKPLIRDSIADIFVSKSKDKEYHKWGQPVNVFSYIIEKMSFKNSLVVDPFLGGGTIAEAALLLDRKFLGCDNDLLAFKRSQERITKLGY